MTARIREVLTGDVEHVAVNCREADRVELRLAYGKSPLEVLRESVELSGYARTGTVDDVPVCMFGVVTVSPGVGRPWLIGTDAIDGLAMTFLRRNLAEVERMHEEHELLTNWVHENNTLAVNWLKWLGFKMLPEEGLGLEGSMFVKFERRR